MLFGKAKERNIKQTYPYHNIFTSHQFLCHENLKLHSLFSHFKNIVNSLQVRKFIFYLFTSFLVNVYMILIYRLKYQIIILILLPLRIQAIIMILVITVKPLTQVMIIYRMKPQLSMLHGHN